MKPIYAGKKYATQALDNTVSALESLQSMIDSPYIHTTDDMIIEAYQLQNRINLIQSVTEGAPLTFNRQLIHRPER